MPINILKVNTRWVTIQDGDNSAEVEIKPVDYQLYRRTLKSLIKVDKDERWMEFCEKIAPEVLVGWRGVQSDGKNIPFDITLALSGFNDRIWSQIISEALKEINEAEAAFRGNTDTDKVAENKS